MTCAECLRLQARNDQLEAELQEVLGYARDWPLEAVRANLQLMEIKGEVRRLPGDRYELTAYGRQRQVELDSAYAPYCPEPLEADL